MTLTTSQNIKNEIKNLGLKISEVSVVCKNSIKITLKSEKAMLLKNEIKNISRKFESYTRCESTGEILSGGNTFVFVKDINGYLV